MKTALCACIKNALFMDSYCNHYLNTIGFDKIYLFEDKGSYSHEPYVKQFGNRVELLPLPELPDSYYGDKKDTCVRQIKLYTWFLEQHKKDYDWIAFFDDDEYMMLPEGLTLKNFLKRYNKRTSVYLYWDVLRTDDMYEPACNYLEQTNYYHYEKFEATVPIIYKVKSIVNTHLCNDITSVHFADGKGKCIFGKTVEELKNYQRVDEMIPYKGIHTIPHIKHFYIRSFESWFKKIMLRGDMTYGHRKLMEYFSWTKFNRGEREYMVREMMRKYNVPSLTFMDIVKRNQEIKSRNM